jgi:hypothetical protein
MSERAEMVAQQAYAAFRGSFRPAEIGAPPHWEQLTERERRAFICVAQWGIDDEAERLGWSVSSKLPT